MTTTKQGEICENGEVYEKSGAKNWVKIAEEEVSDWYYRPLSSQQKPAGSQNNRH